MANSIQIDSLGRVKLDPSGRVILAAAGDPCCCGGTGGTDPCACNSAEFTTCPGNGDPLCCSGKEWDATITASGSCTCTCGLWNLQTGSSGTIGTPPNTEGAFTGDEDAIPDPPPDDDKLFEGTWSLSVTITKRCVAGFSQYRSSGTLQVDYLYYGYREDSNTWGTITDTYEVVWADEQGADMMGVTATVNNADGLFPFVPVPHRAVPTALFPPVWGPIADCYETYTTGGLLFSNEVPWYGVSGTLGGAVFLPEAGYHSMSGTANASNACSYRSNSSTFNWVLYGLPGGDGPFVEADWIPVGGATQEASFALSINVITDCDPDPCEEGARGGL